MDKNTIENRRLLTDEQAQKVKEEFEKKPNIIKGNCFDELLDNVDKT